MTRHRSCAQGRSRTPSRRGRSGPAAPDEPARRAAPSPTPRRDRRGDAPRSPTRSPAIAPGSPRGPRAPADLLSLGRRPHRAGLGPPAAALAGPRRDDDAAPRARRARRSPSCSPWCRAIPACSASALVGGAQRRLRPAGARRLPRPQPRPARPRRLLLFGLYLILFVTQGVALVALTLFGIADTALDLRRRRTARPPRPCQPDRRPINRATRTKTMEVILLERVAKLGQMGETVNVKPGYARNFLLPAARPCAPPRATRSTSRPSAPSSRPATSSASPRPRPSPRSSRARASCSSASRARPACSTARSPPATSPRSSPRTASRVGRDQFALNQPIKTLGLHIVPVRAAPRGRGHGHGQRRPLAPRRPSARRAARSTTEREAFNLDDLGLEVGAALAEAGDDATTAACNRVGLATPPRG